MYLQLFNRKLNILEDLKSFLIIIRNLKISPSEFVKGVVFVRFVVDVDGHITNATIAKGRVTEGMKNKTLRIFNDSPVWKPAIQNEKPVRVMYTIPLNLD